MNLVLEHLLSELFKQLFLKYSPESDTITCLAGVEGIYTVIQQSAHLHSNEITALIFPKILKPLKINLDNKLNSFR